jgi:hypothetical protein
LITIILQAGILADVETLYHTWCKFEGPHSGSLRVGALENEKKSLTCQNNHTQASKQAP